MDIQLKKKAYYSVSDGLWDYLENYGRTFEFPTIYEELLRFSQLFPILDRDGNDTLWKSCHYDPAIKEQLKQKLSKIYSLLKTGDYKTAVSYTHLTLPTKRIV